MLRGEYKGGEGDGIRKVEGRQERGDKEGRGDI